MKYILISIFLLGCEPAGTIPAPTLLDTPDCADACHRMKTLGCEEGTDLPDGTTCTKFCQDTQTSGHALHPSCLVKIWDCAGIEACQ